MKISAVIASLGKEHLLKTIDSLNRGSITPNEIICVLPSHTKVFKKIKNKNVKILFSKKKKKSNNTKKHWFNESKAQIHTSS